jgi:uncharacterized iron-regulated protein
LTWTLEQQKKAIATLVHLQKTGMTEDEIEQLVKLVGGWSSKSITANADIKRKLIRLVHREH